jgi:nucleoid DNA-binding protein
MNERLVTALCLETAITPAQARKILAGLGKIMARELATQDTVSIGTLGTWKCTKIKAGLGKRADGAVVIRPPSYRVTFKLDPYVIGRLKAYARNRELKRNFRAQLRQSSPSHPSPHQE